MLEIIYTKLEMKNSLHGLNKVLDTAQGIINKLEDRSVEHIQLKQTKNKERKEQSKWDLRENIKVYNIIIIGMQKRERIEHKKYVKK